MTKVELAQRMRKLMEIKELKPADVREITGLGIPFTKCLMDASAKHLPYNIELHVLLDAVLKIERFIAEACRQEAGFTVKPSPAELPEDKKEETKEVKETKECK